MKFSREIAKERTHSRRYSSIRLFLGYIGKSDVVEDVTYQPFLEKQTEFKVFSEREVKKLLKVLDKRGKKKGGSWKIENLCHKAMIYAMLYTNIRGSEIILLRNDELIEEDGKFYFSFTDNKGNKRKTFIPENTYEVIQEYLEMKMKEVGEQEDDDALFLSKLKKPLTSKGLWDNLNRIGGEAKIKDLNASKFRHTYSYIISKSDPLHKKAKLLQNNSFQFKMLEK